MILNLELRRLPQDQMIEDGTSSFKPGIFEVCPEKDVVRTYSNGLSFKHIPGAERRSYQLAVAMRVRELGIESANKCYEYAPFIMSLFERYKELEECFDTAPQQEKASVGQEIKEFLEDLGLYDSRFNESTLFEVLTKKLYLSEPKYLAAKFAELCKDRTNLGQSSFLRLVGTGRGYIEAIEKVNWLLKCFQSEPIEFVSFLLFSRAPWIERQLTWRFKVPFSWARNFLVGLSNKFRFSLDNQQIRIPDVLELTISEIVRVIEALECELHEKLIEMEEKGSDTSNLQRFLNSLKNLKRTPNLLVNILLLRILHLPGKH